MALKTYNPTTPSQRQLVLVDRSGLWKGKPEKALTEGLTKSGGRNNLGRLTARRRGGGHKRAYRDRRLQAAASSTCRRRSSGSNTIRTAPPSSRSSATRTASSPTSWRRSAWPRATSVVAGEQVDVKPGNAMPLRAMPVGTIIHNVELKIGRGGQMARAAGAYAQLVGRDQGYAIMRLSSGEQRLVHGGCMATVGAVSNPDHSNQSHRQGRPQPLARLAPERARRGHEPGRPSARRRRGPHLAAAGIR